MRMAVAVLCLVQFVDVLGVTVVVAALPAMLTGLGAPPSAAAPVATGYAMSFGGLLMLGARLGDRHGHRRVLLLGVIAFALGSLVAATATVVAVLVAARCVQGAAAAASVPTALRLLTGVAPEGEDRRRAMTAWSATGAAAGISGYLLGGLLTDVAGWRAVFWVNLPLATVLFLAVRVCVPPGAAAADRRRGYTGLDVPGAVLLTGSVTAVVLGGALLENPDRAWVGLAAIAAGAVLLAGLVAVERRTVAPLLPTEAMRHPALRTGVGAALVNTAATSSVVTLATLHLQQARGLGPGAAAFWLLPCSVGVVVGSVLATPLLRRVAPRAGIATGLAVVAAGDALLLALPAAETVLPLAVAVAGTGLGLSSVATNTLGTAVPDVLQGTAAGALNTAAQLGTALGVSALLLLAATTADVDLPLSGTPLGWAAAAVLAAGTALLVARGRTPAPSPSR